MQWRLLLRRCPSKSLTLVGDMAQATGPSASHSWDDALAPHLGEAWTRRDLTINYRTPGRVMHRASVTLRAAGHPITPPRSVRDGADPVLVELTGGVSVESVVRSEVHELGPGRLAVVTTRSDRDEIARELAPSMSAPEDVLQSPVVVLTADEVKGLEFDRVVVVDPAALAAEGPHGARALFVAMTRPTQRLVLAHRGTLPPGCEHGISENG